MKKDLDRTNPSPLLSIFYQIPWSLYQMFKSISLLAPSVNWIELNFNVLLPVFFALSFPKSQITISSDVLVRYKSLYELDVLQRLS